MNAKAKGSRNERCARRMLESQDWTVIRAGASLGLFDLVAFSRAGLRLVQVKTNRKPGRAESERLAAFDNLPRSTTREVWLFRDRHHEPEIEVIQPVKRTRGRGNRCCQMGRAPSNPSSSRGN